MSLDILEVDGLSFLVAFLDQGIEIKDGTDIGYRFACGVLETVLSPAL